MPCKVYPMDFIKIPSLFRIPFVDKSYIPISIGTLKEGYEEVLAVFRENFKFGYEPEGCNFAAYVEGELVVDLWGGYADKSCGWKWDESTPATIFSCSKVLTSITVAMQVDRGQLQYSDTIAQHWPEFGAEGKGQINVLHALQHQDGLQYFRNKDGTVAAYDFDVMSDLSEMDRLVESQRPLHAPGDQSVYHALTFGWIMDGLMRRVDHKKRSVGELLKEEITDVHGLNNIQIGNPREIDYRIARVQSHIRNNLMATLEYFCDPVTVTKMGLIYYRKSSILRKEMINTNGARDFESINHPASRKICKKIKTLKKNHIQVGQPAVNGVGNARELAKILDIFEGGELCSRSILDKLREPTINNEYDPLFGVRVSKGHGFLYTKSPLGDWQYGHLGVGGQNMRTDTKRRITFAYITNGMKACQGDYTRAMKRLEAALYKCYQKNVKEEQNMKV